jgi:hypothetical protein
VSFIYNELKRHFVDENDYLKKNKTPLFQCIFFVRIGWGGEKFTLWYSAKKVAKGYANELNEP